MRRRLLEGGGTYSLSVIFNEGVTAITVNGTRYTSSTVLKFPKGTSITWSATAATGRILNTSGGTFVLNSDNTISPTTTVQTYTLTVYLESWVNYIDVTINGSTTRYTSTTTVPNIPYNTKVTWNANVNNNNAPKNEVIISEGNVTITRDTSIGAYSYTYNIRIELSTWGSYKDNKQITLYWDYDVAQWGGELTVQTSSGDYPFTIDPYTYYYYYMSLPDSTRYLGWYWSKEPSFYYYNSELYRITVQNMNW